MESCLACRAEFSTLTHDDLRQTAIALDFDEVVFLRKCASCQTSYLIHKKEDIVFSHRQLEIYLLRGNEYSECLEMIASCNFSRPYDQESILSFDEAARRSLPYTKALHWCRAHEWFISYRRRLNVLGQLVFVIGRGDGPDEEWKQKVPNEDLLRDLKEQLQLA